MLSGILDSIAGIQRGRLSFIWIILRLGTSYRAATQPFFSNSLLVSLIRIFGSLAKAYIKSYAENTLAV